LRPKPQYLRFINLDHFNWNEASLTPLLRQMVGHLAKHVQLSWKSMQPIVYIRLVGHTDNTGSEKYNVALGDRRARAVKAELENILKEDILKERIRIAILVEPGPGASAPTADNRTRKGRALNRRVEVFVAPPEPPPDKDKPVDWTVHDPRGGSDIWTGSYQPLPTLPPGTTFKQWVYDWLRNRPVLKWFRNQIWDAIVGKDFGLVNSLLNAAGVSGPEKEAFLETVRALAENPVQKEAFLTGYGTSKFQTENVDEKMALAAKIRVEAGATNGIQREVTSAPPRRTPPPACKPEPGEVADSLKPAGILTKDVEITDKGVLVTDFGIDRRSVKDGAKSELASLIHRLETDPAITEIRIYGFTDCIGSGGAQYHMWLRRARARRVHDLLGPVARAKVKFVGSAPLGTFIGPNTDRAGRARNRSVLIEFRSAITFEPEPPITALPCHEQLIRRALRQLRDDQNLDSKIKTRLGAALGTSLARRDDSFIRPGSASMASTFDFRWSGITEYFRQLCNNPGGAAALSASGLTRKLIELDQDIINGLGAFRRASQQVYGYKKLILDNTFTQHIETLWKKKAHTVYAEY
jgi:outer membrane protein OmpA-like peptidoglycan-associated protein